MENTSIVKRPCVTEKSVMSSEESNKVVFDVDRRANKIQIKAAIEELFSVTVIKVNTMTMPSKRVRIGRHMGSRPPWKKAVVTLKEGDHIEFFESA
ncbi:MAG: 50S ribosomal protein L23 [Nitrospinaceae bacterium]|jgi:large subunit ribosomal protein L23|nr:50S ribosomal protein L23 [Nitrospinaceae bacterium]MBT3432663.1 50S ribosomal protein L23 [Nitrospinaceae bacterium]MBT3820245.1 50S ribosomal protein L23 [Nitrospinaceae bacterium]MBT4095018.1 50S ribosomal protein L23 [Nitrospinaceae bacterium]MBT4429786.1 50S ribosomal protein L23 [Nitrospinaceae bacterium]